MSIVGYLRGGGSRGSGSGRLRMVVFASVKQIGLRVTEDLANKITAARGDVPLNTWIVRAIEAALAPPVHAMTEDQVRRELEEGDRRRLGLGKGYVAPRPKKDKP